MKITEIEAGREVLIANGFENVRFITRAKAVVEEGETPEEAYAKLIDYIDARQLEDVEAFNAST